MLAATKYVTVEDMPVLAEAGVRLVGENRAQDLQEKVAAHGVLFEWDFIGQLQSRRVRLIVPHVRLIHSVASDSALAELARHRAIARPDLRILIEVNIAGEGGKAGIAPTELGAFIARSPVPVAGLMTMPPLSSDPEASRPWFAALRELAARAWPRAPFHGHLAGLRRRRRGGRDDRTDWHQALRLESLVDRSAATSG